MPHVSHTYEECAVTVTGSELLIQKLYTYDHLSCMDNVSITQLWLNLYKMNLLNL